MYIRFVNTTADKLCLISPSVTGENEGQIKQSLRGRRERSSEKIDLW